MCFGARGSLLGCTRRNRMCFGAGTVCASGRGWLRSITLSSRLRPLDSSLVWGKRRTPGRSEPHQGLRSLPKQSQIGYDVVLVLNGHTHARARTHTHARAHTGAHTHAHTHGTRTHTHAHTHARTRTHTHAALTSATAESKQPIARHVAGSPASKWKGQLGTCRCRSANHGHAWRWL